MRNCSLLRHGLLSVLLCLTAACAQAAPQIEVEIQGKVQYPGKYTLPEGSRLLDLALPARALADAYLPGAAWLHQDNLLAQRKLKAGLLFELGSHLTAAGLQPTGGESVALLQRLRGWVAAQPVSGRRLVNMDPIDIELQRQNNQFLKNGDVVRYPARPTWVMVVGAVQAHCRISFTPLMRASDALQTCPRHPAADPDWIDVIQPDGHLTRVGIAAWNNEPSPQLAPGAFVLVRVAGSNGMDASGLNADLANFIATLPLPLEEAGQ